MTDQEKIEAYKDLIAEMLEDLIAHKCYNYLNYIIKFYRINEFFIPIKSTVQTQGEKKCSATTGSGQSEN